VPDDVDALARRSARPADPTENGAAPSVVQVTTKGDPDSKG